MDRSRDSETEGDSMRHLIYQVNSNRCVCLCGIKFLYLLSHDRKLKKNKHTQKS